MATRLANGTYIVINTKLLPGTALALDVAGGQDARGTNVQLYGVDMRDSQYCVVFDGGSAGKEQKLFFPACGRCLDVEAQIMQDGKNVRIWDSWSWSARGYDGEGHANRPLVLGQTWDVYQTGASATYAGTSYPVYNVLCHKDNAYCLEVAGTAPTVGANVDIWRLSNADDPGWVFVPMQTVPKGTYTLRPETDVTCCLGVAGASTADLSNNVVAKAVPDDNSQVYGVTTDEQGNVRIRSALKAGLYLGSWPNGTGDDRFNGAAVRHTYDARLDPGYVNWVTQHLANADDGNGNNVPTFRIVPQKAPAVGYCLDAGGGQEALADKATIQKTSYLSTTSWLLCAAEEYDPNLGAPTAVMGLSNAGVRSGKFFVREGIGLYPCFRHSMTGRGGFSIRLRKRSRPAGGNMGAWTAWYWDINGSAGNDGWGMPGTQSVDGYDGRDVQGNIMEVFRPTPDGSDRYDVQYEVRCNSVGGVLGGDTHGPSATGTVVVAWQPQLKISGVALTPLGLSVMYSSDHPRGGNVIQAVVTGSRSGGAKVSSAPAKGSVLVPFQTMPLMPAEGATVSVRLTMWTSDGAIARASADAKVSYNAGNVTLRPTVKVGGSPSYEATASGYPSGTRLYLVIRRGHGDKMVEVEPGRFLPPLGVPWELFASYQSGDKWATWLGTFPAIKACEYVLSDPGGADRLLVAAGDKGKGGPAFVPSYESDTTEYVTTGRERPVVVRGQTVTAKWTLDGYLVGGSLDEKRRQADWAAHAGLVVFRSPLGYWAKVQVTNVKVDLGNPRVHAVSLSMTEVG